MKKKFSIVLVLLFLICTNSFSIEPDIFVQSTVNRASKLLGEDISKGEKIEKLKSIAKETVDIRGIGFYTLGAKRKSLNNDEKKELTADAYVSAMPVDLFKLMIPERWKDRKSVV